MGMLLGNFRTGSIFKKKRCIMSDDSIMCDNSWKPYSDDQLCSNLECTCAPCECSPCVPDSNCCDCTTTDD